MILDIENVACDLSHRTIIENINMSAENGDFIVILGNNGAGKSTLLKCISRLLPYREGVVRIDGHDSQGLTRLQMARNIAYVAQENARVRCTVYDAILLGRKPYIRWDVQSDDKRIVDEMIEKMNLEHLAMKNLEELSGGEVQKVIIARALVQQPRLLLMDEPTNNLDLKNQLDVLQLVKEICQENQIAAITVLHDLSLAARFGEKFLFVKDHTIRAYGGREVLTPEILEDDYHVPVAVVDLHGRLTVVPL